MSYRIEITLNDKVKDMVSTLREKGLYGINNEQVIERMVEAQLAEYRKAGVLK